VRALQRFFLHNWAWKLGSLGLAIILWLTVVDEPNLITVQAAGVYFENLREGLVITSDLAETVQLELRGPSDVLG